MTKFRSTAGTGVLLALLLLVPCGASTQTQPEAELTMSLTAVSTNPVQNPELRLELHNASRHALTLKVGLVLANGQAQYPNDIRFKLQTEAGKTLQLEPAEPGFIAGRVDPLIVELPAGASWSFPVDLSKYWALGADASGLVLPPGRYMLLAEYTGEGVTQQQANLDVKGISLMPYWTGSVASNALQFSLLETVGPYAP